MCAYATLYGAINKAGKYHESGYSKVIYVIYHEVLKRWSRDKKATISQTAFSWMKIYVSGLKFYWKLLQRVQLKIYHHCVQVMAWLLIRDRSLPESLKINFTDAWLLHRHFGCEYDMDYILSNPISLFILCELSVLQNLQSLRHSVLVIIHPHFVSSRHEKSVIYKMPSCHVVIMSWTVSLVVEVSNINEMELDLRLHYFHTLESNEPLKWDTFGDTECPDPYCSMLS